MYLMLVTLLLVVVTVVKAGTYSPAISTTSGVVQGQLIHIGAPRTGLDVYEFLGIPYAQPPVGKLRFAKPVSIDTKQNTLLIATKAPNACPQDMGLPIFNEKYVDMMIPLERYDEDCLYINAWVPRQALDRLYQSGTLSGAISPGSPFFNNNVTAPLAVMVWLHGGGFSSGSAQVPVYNASALAAYNNVIVISVQYRLGLLGFGYLDGAGNEMPGNMGLWDQLEALKWIQQNIPSFGGNANRVTLFGENAGAASVGFHLLNPTSQPYFNRAIMQSGSPTSAAWSYLPKRDANQRASDLFDMVANKFCSAMGVNKDSAVGDKIACLRAIDANELAKVQDTVLKPDGTGSYGLPYGTFLPVIDGDFIALNPSDLLKAKKAPNKAILLGYNKDESSLSMLTSSKARSTFPTPLEMQRSTTRLNTTDLKAFIREYFAFYPRNRLETDDMIRRFIESNYRCGSSELKGEAVLRALISATTDFAVACPMVEYADAVANISNVYFYSFTHRNSMNLWPSWMGVTHTDEMPFVMGFPFTAVGQFGFQFSPAERLLSRQMMAQWTNFAKFGNVTENDKSSPNSMMLKLQSWPRYNFTDKVALAICDETECPLSVNPESSLLLRFKEQECVFWNEVLPTFVDLVRKNAPSAPPAPPANRVRRTKVQEASVKG